MSGLVAMATAAQERLDAITAELVTANRLNDTLQANNEKLLASIELLKSDFRAHGIVAGSQDYETKTIAALRSAVIAIVGSDADREKWLAGNGWQYHRDGGWRESHLAGVVPFATACEIQIRKDLGPFAWLLNNPSGE